MKKLKSKDNAFKITYTKNLAGTGYQIQYSRKSKMSAAKTKWIKKNTTMTTTISGLKNKKTYYVRVRTYKQIGSTKIYGSWSNIKKVKTK